jgi:hypothetical protein
MFAQLHLHHDPEPTEDMADADALSASTWRKLSPELRDEIYALAVHHEGPIDLQVDKNLGGYHYFVRPSNEHRGALSTLLALTATCKDIRPEALSMFYAVNVFKIDASRLLDPYQQSRKSVRTLHVLAIERWITWTGSPSSHLTSIIIDLGLARPYLLGLPNNEKGDLDQAALTAQTI